MTAIKKIEARRNRTRNAEALHGRDACVLMRSSTSDVPKLAKRVKIGAGGPNLQGLAKAA